MRGGAVTYHVGIRVRDDVGREILGEHLLAEGCELCCGIDRSNWKVLTGDRKTPRHTHTYTHTDTRCLEKMMPGGGGCQQPLLRLGLGVRRLGQNGEGRSSS